MLLVLNKTLHLRVFNVYYLFLWKEIQAIQNGNTEAIGDQ